MSELVPAAKAASGLLKFVPIVARPFRIAKLASAELAERGIHVSRPEVRRLLRFGQVRKSLLTRGLGEHTQQEIARRMPPHRFHLSELEALAEVLLEAHAIYDTANSARYAQLGTGRSIERTEQVVLGALATFQTDDARFDLLAAKLPQKFAREAAAVRRDWPALAKFLGEYFSSEDLRQLFSLWTTRPEVSQAPWRATAFLGELAEAHGLTSSADEFLEAALKSGAQPQGYWAVRRVQCIAGASDDERVALLGTMDPHPWASLASAQLQNILTDEDVDRHMQLWKESAKDPSERSYLRVVEARVARAAGRLDEARTLGWKAWEEDDNLDGAEISIEASLAQDASGDVRLRSTALERILVSGLAVRDRARGLRLPTGDLVRQAMVAALLLQDVDRARSLGQAPPIGEATLQEASNQAVVSELALLFARGGEVNPTKQLLGRMESAGTRADVMATLNETLGHGSAAVVLWHMALSAEPDVRRASQLCMMLAQYGVEHDSIARVRRLAPEVADDIELTASLARGSAEALAIARRDALQNPRVAFSLLQFYQRNGDEHAVDALATQLARQSGDSDLWLTAARVSQRAKRWAEAIDRAENAIARASDSWGGLGNAYSVLVEGHSSLGNWADAAVAAEELHAYLPRNETALWWIIQCRTNAGHLRKGLEAWIKGGRPDPVSLDQALNLMHLRQRLGREVFGLAEALRLVARWPDDERIHAALVATFAGEVREEEEAEEFSGFLQRYFDRFPESKLVRRFEVSDAGNFLDSLGSALGPVPDLTSLETAVREGKLPLGALQAATGRLFATINAAWFASPRFSTPVDLENEIAAVAAALADPVVIDTTAVFALALFDDRSSAVLYGLFASPRVVLAQAADASEAEFDLPTRDSLVPNWGPGPDWVPRRVHDSVVDRQSGLQRKIAQWFTRAEHVHHSVTVFKDEAESTSTDLSGNVWLLAADRAIDAGEVLWSDDSVMRAIARQSGAQAFGTIALIEWAARAGSLSDAERDLLEAQLLSAGFSGVPFRPRTFALALQLDGQEPKGVAAGLRLDPAIDVDRKLVAILRALEASAGSPDSLQGWVQAVGKWLRRIAGNAAGGAIAQFVLVLLEQSWMTSSAFGAVVRGLMSDDHAADGSGIVVDACSQYHRRLVDVVGARIAYTSVRQLVGEIPEALQLRVAEALLRA
ncbi:hypothetical protein [Curtobacterium sp. ME12]|uniref:tetratricopeptide repeat protein n=1 Tax=Curtobacterium sp. ME12 TaxID=2744253 RepID=UPI0015F5CC04|nr:hypothetical protein [Curtobacterium sp. ME12]